MNYNEEKYKDLLVDKIKVPVLVISGAKKKIENLKRLVGERPNIEYKHSHYFKEDCLDFVKKNNNSQ